MTIPRRNPLPNYEGNRLPPFREARSRATSVDGYLRDQRLAVAPWQRRLMASVLLLQRLLDLLDERGVEYANMMQDRVRIEEAYYLAIGEGRSLAERQAIALSETNTDDLVKLGQDLRQRERDYVNLSGQLRLFGKDTERERVELDSAYRAGYPMLREQMRAVSAAQYFSNLTLALSETCVSLQDVEYPGSQAVESILSLLGLPSELKPTRFRTEELKNGSLVYEGCIAT